MHGITPMMPHRLLNQAVPTEGLIRINFRNEVLINKKIGDQYVRIGADSERDMFFLFVCCLLFVGVSMATIIGKPPAVFRRPACPTCGTRMLLVRIFPDKPGHEQRTFECPRCADEITEIVQSVDAA